MFRDRRSARPPRAPVGSPTTIHAGASALEVARRKREQARRLQQEAEQWELGAAGEQATAHELCRLPPSFVSLHDLSVPGSNANADHLVIGQSGLFMVDSKVASGRVPTRDGTLWRGRYPMRREFDTIRFEASRLANHLGVTVTPVVCFAAGELDRPDQVVDGIRVLQLDRLVPALAEPRHDALAAADVVRIADAARRLMR